MNIKLAIKVREVIIIIIGETIPALTAASPIIRAPSIDMVDPKFDGNLKSLSRSKSTIKSNINNYFFIFYYWLL